jgi:hypothetical protein
MQSLMHPSPLVTITLLTYGVGDGRAALARQELRIEVDHDDAPVLGDAPQHRVRHVPRRVAQGQRRGMGEDYRRLGGVQGSLHRALGHVRQVDHHTQTIHLLDDQLCRKEEGFGRVKVLIGKLIIFSYITRS